MNMHSQIYMPRLSKVNKTIIIISAVIFILDFALSRFQGFSLAGIIGLSAANVMNGHVYTLLTYPFLSHGIFEVILNCLMLWMMGSEFEENWGTKRYVSFMLVTILGGALLYLAINFFFFQGHPVFTFPLTGLGGVVGALCMAYAIIYPDRLFSFLMIIPVKAKYFCLILVIIALYQGIASPLGIGAWGQLGAILSAYLFMYVISHKNFRNLGQKITQMTQARPKKSKAKLTIVKDDNDQPPKYWH